MTALGSTLRASSASPAATPTISVPPKAKMTPRDSVSIGATPLGNQPPCWEMLENPAWELPTACPVTTAQIATTMKMRMAVTLMAANQNSASPKSFTETMLMEKTMTRAIVASTHCGTGWKNVQKCR